ncbi:MAG TPA: BatA domain-containing protein, partial [Candidatus Binatia bacterium]|nr:BatA domain-containing protein [Candidatus Binatia bacterium]
MNWPVFTNPLMLAGMAAVGLPLLIHWLTRARPRRIAFPPFKFLVEACAGQQAVNRLRTFILLAIRCLLVLALALLFARPFLKPKAAAVSPQAGKRVVLVLDASLSMRAVQQGVPLFARAQAGAAEVLRSLPDDSEAAVILEGATPRSLLPALSENLPALHDALVKAQPTYEAGDPAAALALAQKMLGGPGTIYIFSDFQKSNWENVHELPGGVVSRLQSVTENAVNNVAITDAHIIPATPVIGEPVEISCTVFNCSPRPRE